MPLFVTPRQLASQADLYHQLGALTSAGVGLIQAVGTIHRAPPAQELRRPLARIIAQLNQGATLSESFLSTGRWLPAFDLALIQAGERSGRLDAVFKLLDAYYHERAHLVRSVISNLFYPLALFHCAFLIFPIGSLQRLVLQGDVLGFLAQKFRFFFPIYAVALALAFACQGRHGETWRSRMEAVTRRIPLLGRARRHLALARLAAALEALLNAGVSVIESWELAAAASGSPALRRAVVAWRPSVLAGQTPAEAVSGSAEFPELFANLYSTGELSGQLDDALRRMHHYYQEEGSRLLKLAAEWSPKLVYGLIMLLIAYQVVTFWSGHYSNMMNLTDF